MRYHFHRTRNDGTFAVTGELLTVASRLVAGRDGGPGVAIIDSQGARTIESGGISGYGAGEKAKGRKRHVAVAQGNLLRARVHGADIQDRDGAPCLIVDTLEGLPTVASIFADGGHAGDKLHCAVLNLEPSPTIEIIRRPNRAAGFVAIARRWVVEHILAWLGRRRRLARGWERTVASSRAWLLLAAIRRATRFIARQTKMLKNFEADSKAGLNRVHDRPFSI